MFSISARNQIAGTVTNITIDGVSAEVTLDIGHGNEVTAVITKGSAERLGLRVGLPAVAVIKATDVLIGTDAAADGAQS